MPGERAHAERLGRRLSRSRVTTRATDRAPEEPGVAGLMAEVAGHPDPDVGDRDEDEEDAYRPPRPHQQVPAQCHGAILGVRPAGPLERRVPGDLVVVARKP